jgi:hypothetical protein
MCSLTLRLLRHKLGDLGEPREARVRTLATQQLADLGEAQLDFGSQADLDAWLREHADEHRNGE